MNNQLDTAFKPFAAYLEDEPQPRLSARTIQIILLREVHDFTILRTEATGELNTAVTPKSISEPAPTLRVTFLGSKQKAPETRQMRADLEEYLRVRDKDGKSLGETKYKDMFPCEFQGNLCCACPRCVLMGAAKMGKANIKHRAIYKTAYSLLPFEEVETPITFNAINDATMKTGQALGTFNTHAGSTLIPSIVTLQGVTKQELVMTIKTLLKTKDYGSRTAVMGSVRNNFVGLVAGCEQIITPLELALEIYAKRNNISVQTVKDILDSYKQHAATPARVTVLEMDQLIEVLKAVRQTDFMDEEYKVLLTQMCDQAAKFGKTVRG